jgi:glucoamylase
MPLAWAHAEFIKLAASRRLGRPSDRLKAVWDRYGGRRPAPTLAVWTPAAPIRALAAGQSLRLLFTEPVSLRWGLDGWQTVHDAASRPTGLGLHAVELPSSALAGHRLDFTWQDGTDRWVGRDYELAIG